MSTKPSVICMIFLCCIALCCQQCSALRHVSTLDDVPTARSIRSKPLSTNLSSSIHARHSSSNRTYLKRLSANEWTSTLEGVEGAIFEQASNGQLSQRPAADHKPLLPLIKSDFILLGCVVFAVFLAAGGGIGGGGVLVPVLILIGGFSTGAGVALSNITIVGGAFANFICNVSKQHPLYSRPLIDWDIILVMEPCTILGALLGSYLNKILPSWLTTICLTVLLSFMTIKLLSKAVAMFRLETERQQAQQPQHTRPEHLPGQLESSSITEPLLIPEYTESPRGGGYTSPLALPADPKYVDSVVGEHLTKLKDIVAKKLLQYPNGIQLSKLDVPSELVWVFKETSLQSVRIEGKAAAIKLTPLNKDAILRHLASEHLYSHAFSLAGSTYKKQTIHLKPEMKDKLQSLLDGEVERTRFQPVNTPAARSYSHTTQDYPCSPSASESARLVASRSFRSLFHVSFNANQAYQADAEHVIYSTDSPLAPHTPNRARDALPSSPMFLGAASPRIPPTHPFRQSPLRHASSDVSTAPAHTGVPPISQYPPDEVNAPGSVMNGDHAPVGNGHNIMTAVVDGDHAPVENGRIIVDGDNIWNPSAGDGDEVAAGDASSRRTQQGVRGRSPLARAPSQNGDISSPRPVPVRTGEIHKLQTDESRQLPLEKLAILCLLSAWTVVSDSIKVDLECGSWIYWAVVLSIVPVIALSTLWMRQYLLHKATIREQAGVLVAYGEVLWTKTTTLVYPAVCSLAGVMAGMFGVGGGIVKGPLMLEMGVDPQVASASSATMILFTSMSASIVYWHWGRLQYDYGVALLVIGFVVTLAGQLVTNCLLRVLARRSVIVFMMGGMMAAAAVVMYYQTSVVVAWAIDHPEEAMHINTICHNEA